MSLRSYHKKRNFKKTLEPKGKVRSTRQGNLYVIQKHAASHLHYDFRLELKGVLKSWAIPKGPSLDPEVKRLAVHVEDHPLDYGDFEGIIPQGEYGAGTVMLWDQGEWFPEDNPEEAYQKGSLSFILVGKKLKGSWKLVKIHGDPKNWLLIKTKDKYARDTYQYEITKRKSKSVKSRKTIEQLSKMTIQKKVKMPRHIIPQLATLVAQPPEGDQWLHEIKLDGYRLIAFIEDNQVQLITRNQLNWTTKFPNIERELKQLPIQSAIFDGEVVILDKNSHTDFQLLQNAIRDHESAAFIYFIFDLLYFDGNDLTPLPLLKRKELLKNLLPKNNSVLVYSNHIIGSGKEIYNSSCKLALEGIVSKKIDSPYIQKRTQNWLKTKCILRQEFIIGGYTKPQGNRKYFGALLLGLYNQDKKLIYCGKVGTGFDEKSLKTIFSELIKITIPQSPFVKILPYVKNANWTLPQLVAEIEFHQWTTDGLLRQPSFKGLRLDKPANKVGFDKILPENTASEKTTRKNKLTNPNKILYPQQGITKEEVYDYYCNVQKWILPYIVNRPLTVLRCPSGHKKNCFYQKHIDALSSPHLKIIPIQDNNKMENYFYINDLEGLLTLAQLGVLEIHSWGSTIDHVEKPDILVFDLDPAPDVKWKQVVEAAFEIKKQLEKLHFQSFVKTTGGKGLHVVVPISPQYEWDEIKIFTHTFVEFLAKLKPNKYIDKVSKSKRVGKIFIDYLRNQRGATAIAPYSTRARPNASIAVPVSWNELKNITNEDFTLKTIYERLKSHKKDPWEDFFKIQQSLELDKLVGKFNQ